MSKMDGLRAMREAKYQAASRAAKPASATKRPKALPKQADAPASVPDVDAAPEALCGHRNMGGKTCTREAGHAAKNHRYS